MTAALEALAARDSERIANEGYFTPEPLAFAIAERVAELLVPSPRRILEPSSGGGAFVRASRKHWPSAQIVGVDISPTAELFARACGNDFVCADFLRYTPAEPFDLVIGNVPYNQAEAHVRHALEVVRPGGCVAMLLRLAFLASKGRMQGICSGPGRYVAPISPRPSFTGGGNDNSEYALFCFFRDDTRASELGAPLFWERAR